MNLLHFFRSTRSAPTFTGTARVSRQTHLMLLGLERREACTGGFAGAGALPVMAPPIIAMPVDPPALPVMAPPIIAMPVDPPPAA